MEGLSEGTVKVYLDVLTSWLYTPLFDTLVWVNALQDVVVKLIGEGTRQTRLILNSFAKGCAALFRAMLLDLEEGQSVTFHLRDDKAASRKMECSR